MERVSLNLVGEQTPVSTVSMCSTVGYPKGSRLCVQKGNTKKAFESKYDDLKFFSTSRRVANCPFHFPFASIFFLSTYTLIVLATRTIVSVVGCNDISSPLINIAYHYYYTTLIPTLGRDHL